jgi:F0F1-type ATP synthase assembly protein I
MFDLYQAPDTAAQRRVDLLADLAADRLALSASETDQASADDRLSPIHRLSLLVTDIRAIIAGAISQATRRPRWS